MSAITIVRVDGVNVYLDDDEGQHVLIGSGETDSEALANAVNDLEEALQSLRNAST